MLVTLGKLRLLTLDVIVVRHILYKVSLQPILALATVTVSTADLGLGARVYLHLYEVLVGGK